MEGEREGGRNEKGGREERERRAWHSVFQYLDCGEKGRYETWEKRHKEDWRAFKLLGST